MTRRAAAPALALALVLGATATASAQRIDAETRIEEHRIDGCSRSTASTTTESTLHLVVDRGHATLELESRSRSAFRSRSRGAGSSGSVTASHEKHIWGGTARTGAGGTLILRFDHVKTAAIDWQGYGTLPLPALTTAPAQLEVRCAPMPLDVYPAAPTGQANHAAGAAERPIPTAGYACSLTSGSAYVLSRLGELPFSKSVPVTRHVSAVFSGEESLIRRR